MRYWLIFMNLLVSDTMGEINWATQEVIINPKLLDMIPKLNSWLPPDYIKEIDRDVQVYLNYKDDWFTMEDFDNLTAIEIANNPANNLYLKNTKTTAYDLTLFCSAWKRNPESVPHNSVLSWAKKVSKIFGFGPVWGETHNGLAEIDDANIRNAIYDFNNPKPKLYREFTRVNILSFIPKGFFILPIQQYPFMNFWETPFLKKKKVKPKKTTKSKTQARRKTNPHWDDFFDSLFEK